MLFHSHCHRKTSLAQVRLALLLVATQRSRLSCDPHDEDDEHDDPLADPLDDELLDVFDEDEADTDENDDLIGFDFDDEEECDGWPS